jgi:hypothetical protein
MRDAAAVFWRLTLVGVVVVGLGLAAILAASLQGQTLVPGGSIVDGYWVGLLPWINVGSWLVPIGGVVATVVGVASIWLGRAPIVARIATLPLIIVVLFWVLLVVIEMAPRNGPVPDSSMTSSDLATVVYSSPANTIFFLLVPAAVVVLLAAAARRRTV